MRKLKQTQLSARAALIVLRSFDDSVATSTLLEVQCPSLRSVIGACRPFCLPPESTPGAFEIDLTATAFLTLLLSAGGFEFAPSCSSAVH